MSLLANDEERIVVQALCDRLTDGWLVIPDVGLTGQRDRQMDIVVGVRLADGSEVKIVSGIDDHSRFVISAYVVARATAKPSISGISISKTATCG